MNEIYVSMNLDLTDEDFKDVVTGNTERISIGAELTKHTLPYRRLYNQSINDAIKKKPGQIIVGIVSRSKDIVVYLTPG